VDTVVLGRARREEDNWNDAQGRILAQSPAKIQTIPTWHHNIQEKECGRLPLGVAKYLIDSKIRANCEPSTFQVVLHQAGDIRIIFQHKNRLTHFV
jgi:hypothetical protein